MGTVTPKNFADRQRVMTKARELGDWCRGLDKPGTYTPTMLNAEIICAGLVKDGYLESKPVPHDPEVRVYKPVYVHGG